MTKTTMTSKPAVLFVCLGNICRSPAAEGILGHLAKKNGINIKVESCGLSNWNSNLPPHAGMQEAILKRGIDISQFKAKQFRLEFFDEFDYILAATKEILNRLKQYAKTPEQLAKIHLMTEYSDDYQGNEVPDPLLGSDSEKAFDQVLDMTENFCEGLLSHIKKK